MTEKKYASIKPSCSQHEKLAEALPPSHTGANKSMGEKPWKEKVWALPEMITLCLVPVLKKSE